jgi:hypothetical protein
MTRRSNRNQAPVRKSDIRDLIRATVVTAAIFGGLVVNAVVG